MPNQTTQTLTHLPMLTWQTAPACLSLSANNVHVWRASLAPTSTTVSKNKQTPTTPCTTIPDTAEAAADPRCERYWEYLDNTERARADRFVFPEHRQRFILAHGILRSVLARYTQQAPHEFAFAYNAFNKPHLTNAPFPLHFNLSHSHDQLLLVLSMHARLGVDVEKFSSERASLAIAERFFSDDEYQQLIAAPDDQREILFFQCWSLKEAFIKAIGEGLHYSLATFSIALDAQPPCLQCTRDNDAAQWQLRSFTPHPGYAGGLALPRRDDWDTSFYSYTSMD